MLKTKKAILTSVMALLLCVSMLLGTTYAWFTDSATSSNNVVQSGKLDVEMYWSDSLLAADSDQWQNVDGTPIFTYDKWEPGYTEVRYIKVKNAGNLSFQWRLYIEAEGAVGELADVIDVYYINPVSQTVTTLQDQTSTGVLTDVINDHKYTGGVLLPAGETSTTHTVGETILAVAFHMDEEAGNEYQGKSVGDGFSVTLLATQYTYEEDSFGNQYDEATLVTNAEELKSALADGKKIVLPDGSAYEEPEGAVVVWNTEELKSALKKANNGKTVFLAAGEFTLPQITKTDVKDITIVGTSLAKVAGMTVYKTNNFNNFTFENISFTKVVKGFFSGNCVFKNCDFTAAGIAQSSTVAASATLTIEGCTFNGVSGAENLHFGAKDGGTIVVKDCVFNSGYVAFGKAMNITFENCDFNGGAASCYGSYVFNKCTFDADVQVYIHANTGAASVNITMNDCTVDGGADVTSICYNTGNNNNGVKTFTIDGTLYNHDELQPFPSN